MSFIQLYIIEYHKVPIIFASLGTYSRLKSVDGVLSNVYDLNPYFFYLEDTQIHKTMEDYDRTEDGELTHSSPTADGKDALLSEVTDSLANEITQYGYDNGKLTAAVTYNNQRNNDGSIDEESVLRQETFVYDDIGRVTKDRYIYEIMNPQTAEQEIVYATAVDSPTPDNRISSYTYKLNGNVKAQTTNAYDDYKRISQKTYAVGGKSFSKKINYTKTRPSSVEDECGTTNIANTAYEYDSMGRIVKEKDGAGNVLKSYTYDAYGQLTKEVNNALDKTFDYVYNGIGNIVSVTTTPTGGTATTETFTYDADKLTTANGSSLTYDANGCLKTRQISGTDIVYNYEWDRGKLSSMSYAITLLDRSTYNYTYDAYGRRTAKSQSVVAMSGGTPSNTTVNTSYDYDSSGRLIREKVVSSYVVGSFITTEKLYLYDESGVIGMIYTTDSSSATYYFQRNIQGDIVAIYDTNGNKVTEYAYDAYGKCTILNTTNSTIAYANPFRYRGYYLDSETGFYYLNARYYSPEWRRFISPDDTAYLDPENVNGLNLYCYCGNDPVNYCDPSGHSLLLILGLIGCFGVLAVGAVWLVGAAVNLLIKGVFKILEFAVNVFISVNEFLFEGISSDDVGTVTGAAIGGASKPKLYDKGSLFDDITIAWE